MKEFYVLKYNSVTGKYESDIVFMDLREALDLYEDTQPEHLEQIIELIWSPADEMENHILMSK